MEGEQLLRRGQRLRRASSRALESQENLKKLSQLKLNDSQSDDGEFEHISSEKPKVLHQEDVLYGDKIFAFATPKRRTAVIQKAAETPQVSRNKMKKQIATIIMNEDDDSDFSATCSEYDPSESSTSSEENADSEKETVTIKLKSRALKQSKHSDSSDEEKPKSRPSRGAKKNKNYTFKTDDYFSQHSSKKIITSNHTLDKLETPRLPQDQLHTILDIVKLSTEHKMSLKMLDRNNRSMFEKWMYLLHENFNVILHGLGSKTKILNRFHRECLNNNPVIIVNGFFPSLSIKDVLEGILMDLLEYKDVPLNFYEACDVIQEAFESIPSQHLYLIVHNIEMVKSNKAQGVFARLSAVKNIHLIASVDHINVPIIWDHNKLSKFNFTWWNVTSFQPYINETSFESSLLVQNSGVLALSSLQNIFLSLTSNSKQIYLILVKYQLENGKNQYYQGLAFKELYSMCRESFLVSSDLALRAQLTEFVDHKIIKTKRSADGTEHLAIPIANNLLQEFLNEQT